MAFHLPLRPSIPDSLPRYVAFSGGSRARRPVHPCCRRQGFRRLPGPALSSPFGAGRQRSEVPERRRGLGTGDSIEVCPQCTVRPVQALSLRLSQRGLTLFSRCAPRPDPYCPGSFNCPRPLCHLIVPDPSVTPSVARGLNSLPEAIPNPEFPPPPLLPRGCQLDFQNQLASTCTIKRPGPY